MTDLLQQHASDSAMAVSLGRPETSDHAGTSRPIMIVDDDVVFQNILKSSLENLSHDAVEALGDGYLALDKLQNGAATELLLLDLHMPGIDGVRFMRQLVQCRTDIDLILVSGQNERILDTAVSLGRSMGLNVLGALPKPFEISRLQALLNKESRSEEENAESESVRRPLSRLDLEDGLAGNRDRNRPYLLFQPIVSMTTGNIVCVEVLSRWWNQERGVLAPDLFLPLADRIGLLDELSRLIYRETLDQVAEWFAQNKKISAAVNLSINSFNDPDFVRFLIESASRQQIDCARLIFEVAEAQTSSVQPRCLEALLSLRLKGFRLSIDDFGTGSSSLTHLKNIPFTELKIDREFVTGASSNASSRSILEESVNLAKRLNIAIVAEGVETREDWELVEALQCDYVQGYYCGKPMGNQQFLEHLEHWQGPHDCSSD